MPGRSSIQGLTFGELFGVFSLARTDLEGRYNVEVDSVKIASAERVDWPDTSLGLPQDGMMYAQVITPGFKLTVNVDDMVFVYHTSLEEVAPVGGFDDGRARPVNPDVPDETSVNSGPITILDTVNLNECNFIHAINACFVDEKMPEGVDLDGLDEMMEVYFPAREDLVNRAQIEPESVKIRDAERVEWSDSSLGQPEPGMSYAQVITPGFKLTLQSGDQTFLYHTGGGRVVFVE